MCFILNTLLVLLNIIVLLFGIGIMSVSLLVGKIIDNDNIDQFLNEFNLTTWLIVVGVIIAIIGFLGSCGVIMKNKCLLYSYAVIVFILAAAQVGGIIFVMAATDTVETFVKNGMEKFFGNYYETNTLLCNATIGMQQTLECCGVDSYKDWFDMDGHKSGNISIGCCKPTADIPQCFIDVDAPNFDTAMIYTEGCFDKIVSAVEPLFSYILYGFIALVVIQVLCMIQACIVGHRTTPKKLQHYY